MLAELQLEYEGKKAPPTEIVSSKSDEAVINH